MTTEKDFLELAEARLQAGLRAARDRFAAMTPEAQEASRARAAGIPELLSRMFISPSNSKGRQTMFIATPAELAEWKAGVRAV